MGQIDVMAAQIGKGSQDAVILILIILCKLVLLFLNPYHYQLFVTLSSLPPKVGDGKFFGEMSEILGVIDPII